MTKSKTGDHPDLKMVNPHAAAIDIGWDYPEFCALTW